MLRSLLLLSALVALGAATGSGPQATGEGPRNPPTLNEDPNEVCNVLLKAKRNPLSVYAFSFNGFLLSIRGKSICHHDPPLPLSLCGIPLATAHLNVQ